MLLLEYLGLRVPALSAPQYSPLPTQGLAPRDSVSRAGKPKLFANKPSFASLRDVHSGPWEGRHARPRPGQMRRAPVRPPAQSSRTRPRRNPGPAKGFPAARGLVAPRTPSVSRGTHGERAEAPELRGARGGCGGRGGRTLRPPDPKAGARTPGRRKQASPGPRRATLTASPWPGGRHSAESLLHSRAPPRSLALLRGLRFLRPGTRPSAAPVASATRGWGSAAGGAAYGGTTEALQADGLGEASGAAVAASAARAAGPQRPLDPTSRYGAGTAAAAPGTSGREREATRPGGGGARCALRRPPACGRWPAPDAASREPEAVGSPHPTPVRPQHLFLPSRSPWKARCSMTAGHAYRKMRGRDKRIARNWWIG
nr:translation initiation factor IF-2-like isoform X1 [Rattus norvegicus]XP_038967435.1 translation initiation factor IF-2-like isoform X1 [Rattus norvegicus]